MKQLPFLILCLVSFYIGSVGQAPESFDISTFRSPKGWNKEATQNSVQISTEDKANGTYCLITLYKSLPGLGSPKENFNAAWQTIVKEAVNVPPSPQTFPSDNKEDWKVEGGFGPFEKNGEKGVAVLYTISGYGKMINFLVLTNSMTYEPTITAFLESVSFRKPEAGSAPVAGGNAESILGTWGMATSGTVTASDYKNPYSVNNYGYGKGQYTFNADGTYSFVSKTFRMTFNKILLVRETGSFQTSGNTITISPQKSVIEAWSKRDGTDKWGALLTRQNRALEKVTYRFTKHYFSGIQLWNLVLQADKATERDGPFSSNTLFNNAWYYAPISSNNPAIELPR